MVTDTGVVPAPIAIDAGLKTQPTVVSVGEKEQPNVTAAANVVDPTGVAVKRYTIEVCPAFTVCVRSLAVQLKSGGAVTFRVNVWVLVAPPGAVAVIVTVELPCGVLAVVLTVNVTVCGGVTAFEGEKIQFVPAGNPEQPSPIVPEKPAPPATWKLVAFEVKPCAAVIVPGFGAVRSATCSTMAASRVTVFVSVPTPCALKL
jgi:hypothetical protein